MDAALLEHYRTFILALQEHPQDPNVEGFDHATLLRILKALGATLLLSPEDLKAEESVFLEKLSAAIVTQEAKEAGPSPETLETIVKEWQEAKAHAESTHAHLDEDATFRRRQRTLEKKLAYETAEHIASEITKASSDLTSNLFETIEKSRQGIAKSIYENGSLTQVITKMLPDNLTGEEGEQVCFVIASQAAENTIGHITELSKAAPEEQLASILQRELKKVVKTYTGSELLIETPNIFARIAQDQKDQALKAATATRTRNIIYETVGEDRITSTGNAYLHEGAIDLGPLGEGFLHSLSATTNAKTKAQLDQIGSFVKNVHNEIARRVSQDPYFGTRPQDIVDLAKGIAAERLPAQAQEVQRAAQDFSQTHGQHIHNLSRLYRLQRLRPLYPAPLVTPDNLLLAEAQLLLDAPFPWVQLSPVGVTLATASRFNRNLEPNQMMAIFSHDRQILGELEQFYQGLLIQTKNLSGFEYQFLAARANGALLLIKDAQDFQKHPTPNLILQNFLRISNLPLDDRQNLRTLVQSLLEASAQGRYEYEVQKKIAQLPREERRNNEKRRRAHQQGFLGRFITERLSKKLLKNVFGLDIDLRNGKGKVISALRKQIRNALLRKFRMSFSGIGQRLMGRFGRFGSRGVSFFRLQGPGLGRTFARALSPLGRALFGLFGITRFAAGAILSGGANLINGFLGGLRFGTAAATRVLALIAAPSFPFIVVITIIIVLVLTIFLIIFGLQTEIPTLPQATELAQCTFVRDSLSERRVSGTIKSSALVSLIQDVSQRAGIPAPVVAAVATVESANFVLNADDNHDAIQNNGYYYFVSQANSSSNRDTNAIGLMQISVGQTDLYDEGGNFIRTVDHCSRGRLKTIKRAADKLGKKMHDEVGDDGMSYYCVPDPNERIQKFCQTLRTEKNQAYYTPDIPTDDSYINLCRLHDNLMVGAEVLIDGIAGGQWTDKTAVTKAVKAFYGACTYPTGNYCDEVWNGYQSCQPTQIANPPGGGTPVAPLPILTNIVQVASEIVSKLRPTVDTCRGKTCYLYNSKVDEPGVYYWCTFLIEDAYTKAGLPGIPRDSYNAVVAMKAFFSNTSANGGKYRLLPADAPVEQLRSGDVIFFEGQGQHVSLIKSFDIDENGNGVIHTYESNNVLTEDIVWVRAHKATRAQTTQRIYGVTGFGQVVSE